MPVRILGISAYYHDSAACVIEDGRIAAAAQEERFTRKKHDASFPARAVEYCLGEAGITANALDLVGFYEKPLVKFDRLLETYTACAPRGLKSYLMALPLWLAEKLWLADDLRERLPGYEGEILFGEHHESHAASAFYPSPFEQAAIVTMDGVGEWATSSIGVGRGHEIELLRELRFPHSLGLLYSAFTYFTGFKVNSGEYKVMGLAPYGQPKYVKAIKDHLVEIRDDGSLWMNMEYFTYPQGLTMTGARFERLFDGPARQAESKLTQREMDLARSVQDVTEEVMLKMTGFARRETGMRDLCLAGGVALNCVGNGRILRQGGFDQIWIQPAAGDAGGALGVAMSLWHRYLDRPRTSAESAGTWDRSGCRYADGMNGSYLGPRYTDDAIGEFLQSRGYPARRLARNALADQIAALLAEEKVIGLFQDRMEFGPRALGARSIIGDARSPKMQSVMNLKIKFRESFRPFAPAVLREHVAEWFELDTDSPYMLLVADVRADRRLPVTDDARDLWGIDRLNVPRSTIPAVTHVDYSARIQTVRRETSPLYYDIIDAFNRRTGCPVIVNTSFNVRGEPIVCTPEDAYRCFMRTNMDVLVLESFILVKDEQAPVADDGAWRQEFVLDCSQPLSDRAERISAAAYWELLVNLTKREVKGRYSQSLFGIGWAIAQPLATMAVFTLVFSRLAKMPSDGAPYPVFAYAALVPWFFFSNSVTSGTLSLITYRNIVTKTYFPREIVPLAQVCSRLLDFCAAAGLYALLMIYYRVTLGPWALLTPVFFLLLMMFTVGFTFATSAANVFYRDVNPVVQIALQLWLYLTPVAYPLAAVSERFRPLFVLNPLTAIVEGFRSSLVFGRPPDWTIVAPSAAITVTLFAAAFLMFKRMDKYFADVI